jgi:hypothetical protein
MPTYRITCSGEPIQLDLILRSPSGEVWGNRLVTLNVSSTTDPLEQVCSGVANFPLFEDDGTNILLSVSVDAELEPQDPVLINPVYPSRGLTVGEFLSRLTPEERAKYFADRERLRSRYMDRDGAPKSQVTLEDIWGAQAMVGIGPYRELTEIDQTKLLGETEIVEEIQLSECDYCPWRGSTNGVCERGESVQVIEDSMLRIGDGCCPHRD